MMGWCGGGTGYGTWTVMGLFWLALIAVIVWAVLRLLPVRHGLAGGGLDAETPTQILDRRFARGELDPQSYRAHRDALTAVRGTRHVGAR